VGGKPAAAVQLLLNPDSPTRAKHTSLYDLILGGASVAHTSQVCSPAMLVLSIVGN
jgi:hypothetical protein